METKKSERVLVNGVDVVKLQKRVKKMEKKVKKLSERVEGHMEGYQNWHQWEPWTPEEMSEVAKNNLVKLSESVQRLDTGEVCKRTIWGQSFDEVDMTIAMNPCSIIDKVEQYFISPEKKDPEGTVTFTTPKGALLRVFNYQGRDILYNVDDVEILLGIKVTDIDLIKDAYGYIPVFGNSMYINTNKLIFEILKTRDLKLFSALISFITTRVELYMKNDLNFLEPGTKVFIRHKTGAVLEGEITARNENAPNPTVYSADFFLGDKIVASTEFTSNDIDVHVFLKP